MTDAFDASADGLLVEVEASWKGSRSAPNSGLIALSPNSSAAIALMPAATVRILRDRWASS